MSYSYSCDRHYKNKRLSILVVDDDKDSAKLFSEILEMKGHNVTTLTEGMVCINRCTDTNYDIIFMDYHIDDLDGTEVTQIIRDSLGKEPYVIAYTGDKSKNALEKFKSAGMNGVLIKPVGMDLLDRLISEFEKCDTNSQRLRDISRKHRNYMCFN